MSTAKIISLAILLAGLPLAIYLALHTLNLWPKAVVGGSQLYFSPSDTTLPPNRTFDIMLDAKTNHVSFVRAEFTFDKTKVQLSDEIQTTQALKTVVQKSSRADANATGRAIIVLALATGDLTNPPTGNFSVATFPLTTATTTNTTDHLVFDPTHLQIIDISSNPVTVTPVNANLSLNVPGLTPTVTPIGAPSATPTLPSTITSTPTPIKTPTPQPTHTPTPTLTPIPTQTGFPTMTPVPGNLSFKVRLQGITTQANSQIGRLLLVNQANAQQIGPGPIQLTANAQGVYAGSFNQTVPAGTYDVYVKSPSHLQKKFANITFDGVTPLIKDWSTQQNQQLLVGDVNGDNKITVEDITAVLSKYTDFSVPVSAGTPEDVNADSVITIEDVALTLLNYTDFEIPGDHP